MIVIRYEREKCRLRVYGHAGAGRKGEDLVCAGASTLAYTLAASVAELERERKAEKSSILLQPGCADISCVPRDPAAVQGAFDTVYRGFRLLAKNYRKFVRLVD